MRRRSEKKGSEEKEVEELLRAAEDEMLLKFSVNSQTTHSNHLDLELVRRFDALKSPSSSIKKESSSSSSNSVLQPKRKQEGELDRFEALKGVRKGGAASSSSTGISERSTTNGFESENEEEDEVAKVIQWAMDAARLDPSKNTDDEDEDEDEDFDDDDEDDRKRKPNK